MRAKTARLYICRGRLVQIRRTDYHWDKCWGVFDVETGKCLMKDVYIKCCRNWINEQGR